MQGYGPDRQLDLRVDLVEVEPLFVPSSDFSQPSGNGAAVVAEGAGEPLEEARRVSPMFPDAIAQTHLVHAVHIATVGPEHGERRCRIVQADNERGGER
jgi:hypothetical protein